MGERYPGMMKYIVCSLCGERVLLICNRRWQWEGSCPRCHKVFLEQGFTLLELLIVLTILAMLAAVVIPAIINLL